MPASSTSTPPEPAVWRESGRDHRQRHAGMRCGPHGPGCLCWLKTPCVSWGKRWPPSPPSIPTRPKKPSRASTWNTSLFRPSSTLWQRWSPEPPGPRGLAHLCVGVRPHSAAREYPEPRHLVCRRPGARLPRIGPDFRAYLYHHLGAPGLAWSPMPAWWLSTPPGAYRCGPTKCLHVAQAARRRAGVL